jgi:hypothetical protein
MTVGEVLRAPALRCDLDPARRTGACSQVIHRPENSAGLLRRFDGESPGTFGFQRRQACVEFRGAQVRFVGVRFGFDLRCDCVPGFLSPIRCVCHRSRVSPIIVGARHWLIFSFSVRARALRSRPASRPSGFCSRACPASPCPCAARLAAKCTSGSPMTPGSVPPGNPATRICSTHPAPHCSPHRAAMVPRRRNKIERRGPRSAASHQLLPTQPPVNAPSTRGGEALFGGGGHRDRHIVPLDDRAVGIEPEGPHTGADDEQRG